jgi:mannose-6-phosphate isomerase-like protein (cupin superfamily)
MRDRGNEPIVFDIRREAFMTPDYRTALWTGGNLQLTVMTIPAGEETGVEMHEGVDQLIGVISGAGEVSFGNRANYFAPAVPLDTHSVVLVPSGTYHNIKNAGRTPLKLYSVYAPRVHKFGTVDKTNEE